MFETEPPYRLPLDRVIYLLRREANCGFIMEDCKIAFLQAADILEKPNRKCANCAHLTVLNTPTIYAYCTKNHWNFESFETDTRGTVCNCWKKKEEKEINVCG